MSDIDNVIHGLRWMVKHREYNEDYVLNAIDLIENEHKGVEPIRVDQWNSVCGVCGEPVKYPYGGADDWQIAHLNFCQRCGRRVKWNE